MAVVVRIYEDETRARKAYRALLDEEFSKRIIALLIPESVAARDEADAANDGFESFVYSTGETPRELPGKAEAPAVSHEELATAVRAGALIGDQADFYLEFVARGGCLVAIAPPFGRAMRATQILDQHKPIVIDAAEAPEPEPFRSISERSTPLSSALGLGVLADPHWALSDSLAFGTRSKGLSFLSRWFGELGDHNYTLSKSFSLPLLSSKQTTFGMSTRSGKSGDAWTRSLGFRMLSSNKAPISGFFGVPLLSGHNDSREYAPLEHRRLVRSPAPLSRFVGIGVLASRLSSLSRMFPPLSRHDFALSSLFGMKLSSSKAAPLSSMLGMKTVSSTPSEEWKNSMGYPLLSRNPAPLSSLLGWPVLIRK
jgi:hypothetical protein